MNEYTPTFVDFAAERCDRCGEVALRRTALGEQPVVKVRWRATKSGSCDHMVLDALTVRSE
ncbi:MAG: hypothetical protein M3442_03155 [Chloroflexota bacterium]|nr:hypothetical protein [Chloroflexota bacterium]